MSETENQESPQEETSPIRESSSVKVITSTLNVSDFRSPQHVADIGRDASALHHVFGTDINRRGNLDLIEDDTVVYAVASAVVFQNVSTSAKEYLLAVNDFGIGCVAVHPSRKFFAVGGRGVQPYIFVYSYPSKKIVKVLSGGAERGYLCMNFSPDGEKLASVSSAPDFMMTIWDWQDEKMGLHSKAFGQDIYNVRFSKDDPGRLTTSGVGHIRFWKMASTFTGLKLQGSIGKFGKIDLSDIENFVEMPDGKVISSTETGSLLVWEGHFIKCRLVRAGGHGQCHDGAVTYVGLDRTEKRVISAGMDGYIRWWDFSTIDAAEVDADHSMDYVIEPLAELYIGDGAGVRAVIDSGSLGRKRLVVVLDALGRLTSYIFAVHEKMEGRDTVALCNTVASLKDYERDRLSAQGDDDEFVVDEKEEFYIDKKVFEKFHSASVTGLDTCPLDNLVATCSSDGTVRVMDYVRRRLVAFRSFSCGATCLKWLPRQLDPSGKLIVVGFTDGVVRVMTLGEPEPELGDDGKYHAAPNPGGKGVLSLLRKIVFKPHNAAVTDISFSSDWSLLATSGADGIVFFFQLSAIVPGAEKPTTWIPLRFLTVFPDQSGLMGKTPVCSKNVTWNADNTAVLVSSTDGVLREFDVKVIRALMSGGATSDSNAEAVTFEASCPVREVITRVPILTAAAATVSKSASSTMLGTTPGKPVAEGAAEVPPPPSSPVKHSESVVSNVSDGANTTTRPGTADTAATMMTVASQIPAKINMAIYSLKRNTVLLSASLNQRNYMFENDSAAELPIRELPNGLYSADGKDQVKSPLVTCFRYSASKKYLLVGTSDGTVTMRPTEQLEVFVRAAAHNGGTNATNVTNGVTFVTTSFDDRFLLSVGTEGTLVVRRVRLDLIKSRAQPLFKDIDAGVYGTNPVKPSPSGSLVAEPNYLIGVSTLIDSAERTLFGIDKLPTIDTSDGAPPPTSKIGVSILEEMKVELDEKDVVPGTYSIQDNRLKLEEDARKVAAEELKGRVKSSILALRKDYENIMRENEAIPEVARLSSDEMLVDKEYLEILAVEGAEMVEEVHRECEHDCERAETLLSKLQSRMMGGLLLEEATLSAFNPPSTPAPSNAASGSAKRTGKSVVKAFRCRSLDSNIQDILAEVHRAVKASELKEAQIRTNETAQRKANEAMDQVMNRLNKKDGGGDAGKDDEDDDGAAALAQLELNKNGLDKTGSDAANLASDSSVHVRRLRRIERKEGLRKHNAEKPNEDEDDVRDLSAIKHAEKTIGDYKLKCADDYEVPEEQRSNAVKKLRQMAMLEESMLSMRLQFNQRFLDLRNLKRQMIFAIRRDNDRIREIDGQLEQPGESAALWEPRFDPDEFPDDADEVTERELHTYEQDRKNNAWDKVKPPKHLVITGTKTEIHKNSKSGVFEAVLVPRVAKQESPPPSPTRTQTTTATSAQPLPHHNAAKLIDILSDPSAVDFTPPRTEPARYFEINPTVLGAFIRDPNGRDAQKLYALEKKIPSLRRVHAALDHRMHLNAKNDQQQREVLAQRRRLEFERSMILQQMQENVVAFCDAIDDLRMDRHTITANLQLAELKLLVLFQEYQLLLTFEGKDAALQQKQVKCKNEEAEIKAQTNESKVKLEAKEDDIQHWVEKMSQLGVEFKALLPDSHPYCEVLTRIFKKKIKRSKGREDGEEDEDYDSGGDDDDEDDEEEVEDICPPGCDQSLFEKILDLREKRLDTEEVCADIQKGIEDLKRTIDRYRTREKQIVKDAQMTELEVQQFQLQKQAALNQISVVVPLRVSQLYMFQTSGSMTEPTDKLKDDSDTADNLETRENIERLQDSARRVLTTDMTLKSHVLFSNRNLVRLKERINELHSEIDSAKEDFKHLHRERGLLTKERENQQKEIEIWSARCRELQMLKFGKEIDLDELEANSDRTKEKEAESQLIDEGDHFKVKLHKLQKISASLEEQLSTVTKRNTKLLNEVAELSEQQTLISRELNAPGQVVTHTSKLDNFRELEEQKRIAAYIKFQATELESLRLELNMLKRKEAPQMPAVQMMSQTAPLPPRSGGGEQLVLPPIPGAKRAKV